MKYSEINLTRPKYNASSKNKAGTFEPSSDYVDRMGWTPPLTEAQLDSSFEVYKQSAFSDINAANPKNPLTHILWSDVSATQALVDGLNDSLITQISNLRANGLIEIKQQSSLSVGGGQATIEPNTMIITTDQLDQDTEDELNFIRYSQWDARANSDGSISWFIGDVQLAVYLSLNGIAWSAMKILGNSGEILTSDEISKLINSVIANMHLGIVDTISFDSEQQWESKIEIFNGGGDIIGISGKTWNRQNVETGGIFIWKPSPSNSENSLAEQTLVDADKTMLKITASNAELLIIKLISSAVEELADSQVSKTEIAKYIAASKAVGNTKMSVDYSEVDRLDVVRFGTVQDVADNLTFVIGEFADNLVDGVNEIENLKTKMTVVEANSSDWINSKSGYAKLSDLDGKVEIDLSKLKWTSTTDGVFVSIPAGTFDSLTAGVKVDLELNNGITLNDVYNNGVATPQPINLDGKIYAVTLNVINLTITISGLDNDGIHFLTDSANPQKIVQKGSVTSSNPIDQTARDAAAAADQKAVNAQAAATAAATKADANKIVVNKLKTLPFAVSVGDGTAVLKSFDQLKIGAGQDINILDDGWVSKKYVDVWNFKKANTALDNVNVGVQSKQQLLVVGLDGKLIKIPKTSLLSKTLTITYSDGTTEDVKVG